MSDKKQVGDRRGGDQRASGVVLVVDDDQAVAEMYRRILKAQYTVLVANDGSSALDKLTDDVDVILLDRMMPGMSGDEVFAHVRERGYDCGVAMVTAAEPDIDIVTMGFDAYVQKPTSRTQLLDTVESLLRRRQYTADLREYCAALSKRAALQSSGQSAATDGELAELNTTIESMAASLDEETTDLEDDMAFLSAIRRIDEQPEFSP